jgi:hypothetical protein
MIKKELNFESKDYGKLPIANLQLKSGMLFLKIDDFDLIGEDFKKYQYKEYDNTPKNLKKLIEVMGEMKKSAEAYVLKAIKNGGTDSKSIKIELKNLE